MRIDTKYDKRVKFENKQLVEIRKQLFPANKGKRIEKEQIPDQKANKINVPHQERLENANVIKKSIVNLGSGQCRFVTTQLENELKRSLLA